ncbi:hypothetical protein BDV29DRAFT_113605 [Aspergillus leporis]|jgi:hypothetical protein|uniref:Uncharacterized protein n=1 Tax=Aspergillus leporis TaxID=41062 RepID=A0A5N5X2J4_9EURO|nr:hypothetical protein BDV29DRAFT_113605 [Aspergillus leporis]
MPYKIDCSAARKKPDSSVFKLKRSWGKVFEDDPITPPDIGQTFFDEGNLHHAPKIELLEESVSDLSEVESATSADSEDKGPRDEPPTYIVTHPWEIVDYHLYLCSVEKGKDTHARRNGLFVFDGIDCRPIYYNELFEERAFDQCNIGEEPQFLFWVLPIADLGPSFNGRHYVLGFDYKRRTLFARHFDWIPNKTDDIWCVWELGFTMYSVTIPDLVILLESGLSDDVHVGLGLLSSSPYCMALGTSDDPGMEIVITILFCQWVLDFAEAIFEQDEDTMKIFKERLAHYVEECRVILARASYRAWFASRDGYTKKAYQRNSSINKFTSDLFIFSKSVESGSLKNRSWRAPGLETCNMLRRKDRAQRRAETERQLESLFIIPETDTPPETPEKYFERMLARSKESLIALYPAGPPRTPSPHQDGSVPPYCGSPMSPGIVKAKEADEDFEVTDFHKIPLPLLLKQIIDLVEARPELDSADHRVRFGELLSKLGIGVQRKHIQDFSKILNLGYENDSWELEVRSTIKPKASLVHHLCFDPKID